MLKQNSIGNVLPEIVHEPNSEAAIEYKLEINHQEALVDLVFFLFSRV